MHNCTQIMLINSYTILVFEKQNQRTIVSQLGIQHLAWLRANYLPTRINKHYNMPINPRSADYPSTIFGKNRIANATSKPHNSPNIQITHAHKHLQHRRSYTKGRSVPLGGKNRDREITGRFHRQAAAAAAPSPERLGLGRRKVVVGLLGFELIRLYWVGPETEMPTWAKFGPVGSVGRNGRRLYQLVAWLTE